MKSRLAKKVLACIASAAVLVTPVYAIDVKVYDECVSVSGTIKAAKSGEKVTVSVLPQGESWDGKRTWNITVRQSLTPITAIKHCLC